MKDITFFHMNERDFSNKIYQDLYSTRIDLYDLKETYIMCPLDVLKEISKRLSNYPQNKLYYLGNGNYHYLTLVLLARLQEPFTLITFDHHHDAYYLPFLKMTSCSSWIQTALEKIKLMEKVIIIGANAADRKEKSQDFLKKLFFLSEENISKKALEKIAHSIETENIYISVDRDFLSKNEVQTNWDQGNNQLSDLLEGIELISKNHQLVGADVCGDIIWDFHTLKQYTNQATLEKSLQVNKIIFKALSLKL